MWNFFTREKELDNAISYIKFDFNERIKFIDKKTSEEITTDPWHITKQYNKHFQKHCNQLKYSCGQNRIEYVQLQSNQPLDIALSELLLKRKNYSCFWSYLSSQLKVLPGLALMVVIQ